jgi:N-methylhydantoinase A
MYRIGVDVGGTFTDVTLLDSEVGKYYTYKLPSTPYDQSIAIMDGTKAILELYNIPAGKIGYFGHGTTVATNMIIERKGAKTALLTTRGFGDILEIGRQVRPSLYNLFEDKPETLIKRSLRREIPERTMSDGSVLKKVNPDEVEEILRDLKAQGVESLAVCFLFSFLNNENEKLVEACIRKVWPEVYYSVSSSILPEFREFERLSTTVINSYLGPKMKLYIGKLGKSVKKIGITVEPHITQSNGGIMSISSSIETPVHTVLSGPSAGVCGATYIAALADIENIITYDMGGTSTDVSLVINSTVEYTTKRKVCGLPSGVPMIDIHTIGAGGGSITCVDNAGVLKVGPESAGAIPGPACYDLGGENPTVTDANLVLGYINPNYFLGGRMKVNAELAKKAIGEKIANKLCMTVDEAAQGILTVVNSNMVRAIRVITVERGYNPSDFTLVAYGGAGPLHAVHIAQDMGISKVLVPPTPGTLCALGLLVADIKKSYVKTCILNYDRATVEQINSIFDLLVAEGNVWLASENVPEEGRRFRNIIEMRYVGQNYELQVNVPSNGFDQNEFDGLKNKFFMEHEKNYGYYNPTAPIQMVNFRVEAIGIVSKPKLSKLDYIMSDVSTALIGNRDVFFARMDRISCPVYDRNKLGQTSYVNGPCIIEQMDSTTLIPPHTSFKVDCYGNIIVNITGEHDKQ